jgi:hypothetical protein
MESSPGLLRYVPPSLPAPTLVTNSVSLVQVLRNIGTINGATEGKGFVDRQIMQGVRVQEVSFWVSRAYKLAYRAFN